MPSRDEELDKRGDGGRTALAYKLALVTPAAIVVAICYGMIATEDQSRQVYYSWIGLSLIVAATHSIGIWLGNNNFGAVILNLVLMLLALSFGGLLMSLTDAGRGVL
ncbi:hypothetical protein RB623_00445 [Mesorhizobium sp. LHD-90]|uniref:hypothetical protein n=1 Tax=Mesorhizobium sp. LHD-90 TaxID=3071414 RepID=UPI0027DF1D06|nr:hypothetical protein [Mesorhizobium sp. LHD-90]MDQ6432518.1 hypothetical protein [Mesorhizobium sp. LHD-90]